MTKTARKKTHAKRDTLKYARDIFQEIAGDCAFKHSTKIIVKDQCKIEQKVMFLENIFLELTLKLFKVEEELKLCKHNKSSETKTAEINDHKEDFKESNITSDKDIEKELQDSTNDSTEEEDNLGKPSEKKKIQNVNFFQKGRGGSTPKFTFFQIHF